MERRYRIPVGEAKKAARAEESPLLQGALALSSRLDAELEERFAGEFHFRAERKSLVPFESHDPPEVERFPIGDRLRVPSAAA